MRRTPSWTLTLAVLLVALLLNGGRPRAAPAADVEQLQQLYTEFLTFKNDPDFHAVGYDECCRYSEWRKKVEALRGGPTGGFLTQFGIGPGDLIMLGREYSHGRGHGDTAETLENASKKAPASGAVSRSLRRGYAVAVALQRRMSRGHDWKSTAD